MGMTEYRNKMQQELAKADEFDIRKKMKNKVLEAEKRTSFEDSGLTADYKDRWENNPYWKLYDNVKDTTWDSITGAIGRSGADKLRSQYKQLALEYEEGLRREMEENKYNSPEEQVNRLNAAGINPDINGLQGSGEDTGFNEPESTAIEQPATDIEQIGSAITNAISMYFTIAGGIKGLAGQTVENRAKEIGLDNEIWQITGKAAMANQVWKEDKTQATNDMGEVFDPGTKTASYEEVLAKTLFPGKSKKDIQGRKKVIQFYRRQANSLAQATAVEQGKAARGMAIASGYGYGDMMNLGQANIAAQTANANAAKLQAYIESKYKKLEENLLNDKEYISLWKDEKYQDLRTKYELGKYQESEAEFNAGVLGKMGEKGMQDKANAMLEEYKTREKQALAEQKQYEIRMASYFIQEQFWNDVNNRKPLWQYKVPGENKSFALRMSTGQSGPSFNPIEAFEKYIGNSQGFEK